MFVCFLYFYLAPNDGDQWVSREVTKMFMWASALLAVIAHLTPKKDAPKDEDVGAAKNFSHLNEKLKESLMVALKIDEQKRLDYIKQKPPLQGRAQMAKKREETAAWQPIIKQDTAAV